MRVEIKIGEDKNSFRVCKYKFRICVTVMYNKK